MHLLLLIAVYIFAAKYGCLDCTVQDAWPGMCKLSSSEGIVALTAMMPSVLHGGQTLLPSPEFPLSSSSSSRQVVSSRVSTGE